MPQFNLQMGLSSLKVKLVEREIHVPSLFFKRCLGNSFFISLQLASPGILKLDHCGSKAERMSWTSSISQEYCQASLATEILST